MLLRDGIIVSPAKLITRNILKSIPLVRSFQIKNNSGIVSGDFYNGDWYIPGLYFCGSLDKIFKFTNGEFIEWTDKLDTKMIKSYADVVVKDRNGFPLFLQRNYHIDIANIAANNSNFSLDFESLCA